MGIFLGDTNYQNQKIGSKSIIVACDLIYKKFKIFKIYLGVRKKNLLAISSYKNAGFYIYNDLFWVINKIPYARLSSTYGSGELFHFIDQMNYVVGIPIYILFWDAFRCKRG